MGKTTATVFTIVVAAVVGASLLAGCAQNDTAGDSASPTQAFNDTDVAFAQQMIVHHQQAIMMAEMAQTRAENPRIKRLAAEIEADQEPQIQMLTRLLQAWGQPVPTMTPGEPGMTPHMPTPTGTPPMPMMTPPDISSMMDMEGAEFDRMFLEMMIEHHESAVALARTELESGVNPKARRLAKDIETTQTVQIAQMRQLLATPSPTPS